MPTHLEIIQSIPSQWCNLNWKPCVKTRPIGDMFLFWTKTSDMLSYHTHVHLFPDDKIPGRWCYNIKCGDKGAERSKHRINPAWSIEQLFTQILMDWFYECRDYFEILEISDIKIKRIIKENKLPMSYLYYSPIIQKPVLTLTQKITNTIQSGINANANVNTNAVVKTKK